MDLKKLSLTFVVPQQIFKIFLVSFYSVRKLFDSRVNRLTFHSVHSVTICSPVKALKREREPERARDTETDSCIYRHRYIFSCVYIEIYRCICIIYIYKYILMKLEVAKRWLFFPTSDISYIYIYIYIYIKSMNIGSNN